MLKQLTPFFPPLFMCVCLAQTDQKKHRTAVDILLQASSPYPDAPFRQPPDDVDTRIHLGTAKEGGLEGQPSNTLKAT